MPDPHVSFNGGVMVASCKNGHEYTKENTKIGRKDGWRRCRICARAANIKYNRRVRDKPRNEN